MFESKTIIENDSSVDETIQLLPSQLLLKFKEVTEVNQCFYELNQYQKNKWIQKNGLGELTAKCESVDLLCQS